VIRHKQKYLISLVLICLSILFLSRTPFFKSLQFGFLDASSQPVQWFSAVFWEAKKILYYHRTFDEYKKLKEEVDILRTRLMGQEEVIRENTRLQRLLDFKRKMVYSSIVARVIGREPSHWNSSIIIDKGAADNLTEGLPVVNDLGVVGKVVEVGTHQSKVMLLTDPQFSVAVLIKRVRENGLISGTLQGKCQLTYVHDDADIRVGDKVITSQLSSSFPESLFVGYVESIHQDGDKVENKYIVKPYVSFSGLEEVLVIQQ
jgi:rod shape-determining protein MreC